MSSTPASTDDLEEVLALIRSVSLSPASVEQVITAARQHPSILVTGPYLSPSINVNVEVPPADNSESLDADNVPQASDPPPAESESGSEGTPEPDMLMDTDAPDPNALAVLNPPPATDALELDPPVVLSEHYTESHVGVSFYLPMPNVPGPYYLITKGRAIGIIAQWHQASPLISDVSGAVYCKAKCLTQARQMMETAIKDGNTSCISMRRH